MTAVIPETSEELEELLSDGSKVAALVKAGQFAETIKAYAKKQAEGANGELTAQLKEAMQAGYADFLRDSRADGATGGPAIPHGYSGAATARPGLAAHQLAAAARQKLYSRKALGAGLDAEEYGRDWGSYLNALYGKGSADDSSRVQFRDRLRKMRNAMSERVPSEGGFLVPENLRSDMLMLSLEQAVVRPRARVIPMNSLTVPYPTVDDPSHASSVFGGVIGYWTAEAAALTESAPSFGRVLLEARKLTGYTEIPNELLEDSVEALDQFFREMFPEALTFFEDNAFINGSGVGEPEGIINADCLVSVTRTTSSEVQFADIAAMYPRMLPQSLNRAVWICSPAVIGQLLQLVLISGSTPVAPPLWLQSMNAANGIQYTLLGRPLIVSEKVPDLGSKGDIMFVDFGYYLLGDRQAMQVSSSTDYKFQNDITAFRVIERADGRAWLRSALTPANGSSSTLSPIVALAA